MQHKGKTNQPHHVPHSPTTTTFTRTDSTAFAYLRFLFFLYETNNREALQVQPIHLLWHIVIYIIIIYHGTTNILLSVYSVRCVSASPKTKEEEGNCSLSWRTTTQATATIDDGKPPLWEIVQP